MTLRIGSVPYLNAKPLVDWFHSPECSADVELIYEVPSRLAAMLEAGEIDVANVSIFEGLRRPELVLIPDISISAYGPVKSVRLFSRAPLHQIRSVALDTSSLTSSALTRILLESRFGLRPQYVEHAPELDSMLAECDAGLIIGDLKLFDLLPGTEVMDLGAAWQEWTGLPFVYAGWLARPERLSPEMAEILTTAKNWGVSRLEMLAERWAGRMGLPLHRCQDYLIHVMNYDLTPDQLAGLHRFREECQARCLLPVPGADGAAG